MRSLAECVFADEQMAGTLGNILDGAAFAAEAGRRARALNVAPPADLDARLNELDPLGLARWVPPSHVGSSLPPRHWLPVAVGAASAGIVVDWAWFGPEPLRAPFYEDEILRMLALPLNRALRYRCSLADLVARSGDFDACEPDGFIFHMSRCGSTLVAQMLAALSDAIVISEAAPIDAVVQLCRAADAVAAAQTLRAIIAAFGRRRGGNEKRYVVKLDAWHALALPLFRRAFPDVPWVFLHRDPVEVLVSQMRQRGVQTVPQYFLPSLFGISHQDDAIGEDYCARVLAAICYAAVDNFGLGGGLVLDYRALPNAVAEVIFPHFGLTCSDAEREATLAIACRDAKSPLTPFTADAAAKQRAATAEVRDAADRHLVEVCRRLEVLGSGSGAQASSRTGSQL